MLISVKVATFHIASLWERLLVESDTASVSWSAITQWNLYKYVILCFYV